MAPEKILPTIEEIRERLSPLFRDKDLRLVVLFGSVATGAVHPRSDIDLAFLYDRPVDILALTNEVSKLLQVDAVDIVDLKRASPLLKFSAVKYGKPVHERSPGVLNEFHSLAFRMYVDTKKLRDARATEIANYLESKGLR